MSVEDAASFPSISFQGSPYAATINNRHYIQTKQLLSSYFIVVLIKIGINFLLSVPPLSRQSWMFVLLAKCLCATILRKF